MEIQYTLKRVGPDEWRGTIRLVPDAAGPVESFAATARGASRGEALSNAAGAAAAAMQSPAVRRALPAGTKGKLAAMRLLGNPQVRALLQSGIETGISSAVPGGAVALKVLKHPGLRKLARILAGDDMTPKARREAGRRQRETELRRRAIRAERKAAAQRRMRG